jgi:hypothetical protein
MSDFVRVRRQSKGLDVTVSIPSHMRSNFENVDYAIVEKEGDAIIYKPVRVEA